MSCSELRGWLAFKISLSDQVNVDDSCRWWKRPDFRWCIRTSALLFQSESYLNVMLRYRGRPSLFYVRSVAASSLIVSCFSRHFHLMFRKLLMFYWSSLLWMQNYFVFVFSSEKSVMSPSDVSQKLRDANKQLDLSFSVDGSGRARGHDRALQYQLAVC